MVRPPRRQALGASSDGKRCTKPAHEQKTRTQHNRYFGDDQKRSLLIERADMIFRQAMAAGQFNAAISALKELGVLSGKRVERSERGEPGEFDRMSDAELRAAVTEQSIAMGFQPPDETQH
jgi:hypothetical protein